MMNKTYLRFDFFTVFRILLKYLGQLDCGKIDLHQKYKYIKINLYEGINKKDAILLSI